MDDEWWMKIFMDDEWLNKWMNEWTLGWLNILQVLSI